MPTNDEPKQDSIKDQTATAELEKKAEEIPAEDADTISGGFNKIPDGSSRSAGGRRFGLIPAFS